MRVELAKLHQKLKTTVIYVTHDQTEAMTLGQRIVLLKDGEIQQTASPAEMYEKPENVFVASFIGSPQINMIDGIVRLAGEKTQFESSSFTVDVADKGLRKYAGQKVTMGIRPEALVPGEGPLACRIEVVERLGSETILYAAAGNTRIAARVPADFDKARNDEIAFSIASKGIHFFHRGKRIAP
jgi:multiple sugar transport system ATP-binding protein